MSLKEETEAKIYPNATVAGRLGKKSTPHVTRWLGLGVTRLELEIYLTGVKKHHVRTKIYS